MLFVVDDDDCEWCGERRREWDILLKRVDGRSDTLMAEGVVFFFFLSVILTISFDFYCKVLF
jgi:hypothetical protein